MERKQILEIVNSGEFIHWFYAMYDDCADDNGNPIITLLIDDIITLEQPVREWADKQERQDAVMRKAQARDRLVKFIAEFQANDD